MSEQGIKLRTTHTDHCFSFEPVKSKACIVCRTLTKYDCPKCNAHLCVVHYKDSTVDDSLTCYERFHQLANMTLKHARQKDLEEAEDSPNDEETGLQEPTTHPRSAASTDDFPRNTRLNTRLSSQRGAPEALTNKKPKSHS